MTKPIDFGPLKRRPAPPRWGATNLLATPIVSVPLVVEHHYEPGGEMPEHAATEPILCICISGHGFVSVRGKTSKLNVNQAVVWPIGETHKVWTTDASMTVLLVHFPGTSELKAPDPSWT